MSFDIERPEQLSTGRLDVNGDAEQPPSVVAAVLWIPDPEQRHFWREYYIKKAPALKPGARLGF